MRGGMLFGSIVVALLGSGVALAQGTAPAQTGASTIAATVNGQPITEVAVSRGLKRVHENKKAEARTDVIKFLVDYAMIDQHLVQMKIAVDPKEVAEKIKQLEEDLKKNKSSLAKMMQELNLAEAELRAQIEQQIRWDKYAANQATDKALHDLYERNKGMFDGSMVRARHILISSQAGDAKANTEATAKLVSIKKEVENAGQQALAKQPPQTPKADIEKARRHAMDETFAALAKKESACPSKTNGGDLDWFPYGSMVGPFADAAFALQPYQLSGVVKTQFGQHLIMVTDRRPGKEPKFEDVKDDVKEVFYEQMREALLAKLRPTAKVVINPAPAR